jgi:hypothetical protein
MLTFIRILNIHNKKVYTIEKYTQYIRLQELTRIYHTANKKNICTIGKIYTTRKHKI